MKVVPKSCVKPVQATDLAIIQQGVLPQHQDEALDDRIIHIRRLDLPERAEPSEPGELGAPAPVRDIGTECLPLRRKYNLSC
ncbi:MAG: hypothetical protein RIC36_14785 [Rhodospirillales bacterium]